MSFVATWMDLEISYKVKKVRERQIAYDITYMWNLKYDINECIYKTETKVLQKMWLPKGKASRGGTNSNFEISRHKLLCIKQINNKDL